jgi:benzoyl-CoA reductase/2-hydroxyglutaryl-CoA dehydratase subunit BcrC/BadD/HgdB
MTVVGSENIGSGREWPSLELAAALREPLAHARAAKAHRPVVAFMSNNIPIELIHAAGCFPLQLPALPGDPTPRADLYMEQSFDPMARSIFERLLRQDFSFVDLIVFPRSVDSFHRFYYYLCELRRMALETVPESFLYDLLHTPWYSSAEYNYASTVALQERLEDLAGIEVSDGAMLASIALYNRIRRKLSVVSERRHSVPCTFAGTDAIELLIASQHMAPEAFEGVLDALLTCQPRVAEGTRVIVVGSAQDTSALHASIGRAGGQVVADHHWRGDLLFGPCVEEALPPLRALSTHYHRDSASVRTYPAVTAGLVQSARRARAQAAIFYHYAEEEALTWDYPAHAAALAAIGVPALRLDSQPYPPDDAIQPALSRFFANLPPVANA